MRPTADGSVAGYLLTGQGTFEFHITSLIEVEQLARFSGRPATEFMQEPVTAMIIRTSRDLTSVIPPVTPGDSFEVKSVARDRHADWQRAGRFDIDTRILAGLLTEGDDYLLVDMKTERLGWLTFELEPWSIEPVSLNKLQKANFYVEKWVSLPRLDESPGLPGYERIDLLHIDAEIDLTEHDGREHRPGYSIKGDIARSVVTERFAPLVDGARALQFQLHPTAKVLRVSDENGSELE
jgi:hypothetical protein